MNTYSNFMLIFRVKTELSICMQYSNFWFFFSVWVLKRVTNSCLTQHIKLLRKSTLKMNPEINTFSIINNFKFEFYDVGYILTSVPLVLEYILSWILNCLSALNYAYLWCKRSLHLAPVVFILYHLFKKFIWLY